MEQVRLDLSHDRLRTLVWMLAITGASLGFSFGFACATPFAALAAVASLQLDRRDAVCAVLLAWLGNQTIGYLVLDYPKTWDSFAWGGAIGVAALLAVLLAPLAADVALRAPARIGVAFVAAFSAYEATIYAASFALPSEGNAFAVAVVVRILEVNLVAYAALLALHRIATGLGLLAPARAPRAVTA